LSKEERAALAIKRLEEKRLEAEKARNAMRESRITGTSTSSDRRDRDRDDRRDREKEKEKNPSSIKTERVGFSTAELEEIKNNYVGGNKPKRKVIKASEKFTKVFQFDWDGKSIYLYYCIVFCFSKTYANVN
jgi:ATP-dependent RNA helicase DDX23/PRP28